MFTVPVDGNGEQGEYVGHDGNALDVAVELAHEQPHCPLIGHDGQQLEGHVEDGDEKVTDRKGHDEQVGD